MILDWTNWTFWLIALALVAFGFCLREIHQHGDLPVKSVGPFATNFTRSMI